MRSDPLIVLDEAYGDFAPEDGLRLVERHSALLVLRTFSKSYSAAGIRVGFGFGHPKLIGRLRNIQNVFDMNVVAHALGMSVLAHRDAYEENHRHVRLERQRVAAALSEFGFSLTPSHANFLLARVPVGQSGRWWQAALEEHNVLGAFFPDAGLEEYIRVSISTKRQMDALLRAVAAFLRKLDAVASGPFNSCHGFPFVIDLDEHLMRLRDAAGVSFHPISA
ncbi:histidinol-phosphate/aromatic aminotransferase/cobyric acid decarboxylase-like protein [Bradyrhizobium sp. i1.15.2]